MAFRAGLYPTDGGLVSSVAISPDGKLVAAATNNDEVRIWDFEHGTAFPPFGKPGLGKAPLVVAFSEDGRELAIGYSDGRVAVLEARTQELITDEFRHSDSVRSVSFGSKGKNVVSASGNSVFVWDRAARRGRQFTGHADVVNATVAAGDGQTLASGTDDGTVILWDMQRTLNIDQVILDDATGIRHVAFSPDGTTLAFGGGRTKEQTVRLRSTERQEAIANLAGRDTGWDVDVAFSKDGNSLGFCRLR